MGNQKKNMSKTIIKMIIILTVLAKITKTITLEELCVNLTTYNRENFTNLKGKKIQEIIRDRNTKILGRGGNGINFKIDYYNEINDNDIAKDEDGNIDTDYYDNNDNFVIYRDINSDDDNNITIYQKLSLALKQISVNFEFNSRNEKTRKMQKRYIGRLIQEILLLKDLQNRRINIIPKYYNCMYDKDLANNKLRIYILQELLKYDLDNKAFTNKIIEYDRDVVSDKNAIDNLKGLFELSSIYFKLFYSIDRLHTKNNNNNLYIVHNDIKPANIMIDYSNEFKIIDFGLSGYNNQLKNRSTPCFQFNIHNIINNDIVISKNLSGYLDIYSMALTIAILHNNNKYKDIHSKKRTKRAQDLIYNILNRIFNKKRKRKYDDIVNVIIYYVLLCLLYDMILIIFLILMLF